MNNNSFKLIKTFNPRRFWLLTYRTGDISEKLNLLLPGSYEPSVIYTEVRNRVTVLSKRPESLADLEIDEILTESNFFNSKSTFKPSAKQNKNDAFFSGAEATAIYGGFTLEKFQQVDEYVYQAMSKLAGENVATISDLHSSLGEYKHDFWGSLTDKAQDKWKGHLAEEYAANDFAEAGHNVEWPEASNQQGWDLLVDSHEVNVKLVANSAGLYSHFEKFPDIPVVVPHDTDLGGITDNVFHFDPSQGIDYGLSEFLTSSETHRIIVDEAMSAADVASHATDAADVAVGGAAAIEGHIPWITVATAGLREGRLLLDGRTDVKSAAKNLASDTVGRGGGAFAGAKAGSFLGSAGGPIGAAAGGILGAIGGAILGGIGSSKVKRIELDRAIDAAEVAQSSLKEMQDYLEKTSNAKFLTAKVQKQNDLNQFRQQEQEKINDTACHLKHWRESTNQLPVNLANELLIQAESEILSQIYALDGYLKQRGFWKRWVWPSIDVITAELANEKLNSYITLLEKFKDTLPETKIIYADDLFLLLGKTASLANLVYDHVFTIEKTRLEKEDEFRNIIQSSYQLLLKKRQDAFSELSNIATEITEHVKNKITPKLNEINLHIKKIDAEKAKLGIS